MLPEKAEAVVIGDGVVGAATAYFLAKAGLKPVLVDKGGLAGEASAANAAWVWSLTRRPGIDYLLAEHSIAIHQQLLAELDYDSEYRQRGGLLVALSDKEIPHLEAHAKARAEFGKPVEFLDRDQTLAAEPLLTEKTLCALYSRHSGCTNPIRLTLGLLLAASRAGASVNTGVRVVGLETGQGRVRAVVTDQGRISTGLVVNAAGSWAGEIGRLAGLQIPISPHRMGLVVTEGLPPTLNRVVMGASYMVEEYEKDQLADSGGFGCALVAGQQVNGNLILGSTWTETGFDKEISFDEITAIAAENVRFFPDLAGVRVIRSFTNFFPFTSDDLPILGPVKGLAGFIMAAGHNGHGVCLGPGTGKLIQELITQGRPSLDISELALERFQA